MGKKKTEESDTKPLLEKEKPKEDNEKPKEDEEAEEDTPIVKTLKEIDDKFCKLEIEYEAKEVALRREYDLLQAPILEERAVALADASTAEEKNTGTPACKGFWLQAIGNCSELSEFIEEHDQPVLEYLKDIKASDIGEDPKEGGKLEFFFAENPYFTNDKLWIEYRTDYEPEKYKPYEEVDVVDWKSSGVDWKAGKNVTVELAAKKTKGGGAKKAKQKAKMKEEPRNSFFRIMFRNLKRGDPAPDDLPDLDMDDVEDDEDAVDELLGHFEHVAGQFKEVVVKYGIRLYTGEIADSDDEDDEGEESESEGGDEEVDDDDDDDEDDAPKGKGKAKKKPAKSGATPAPAAGKGAGKTQEECKQQ